MVNQELTFQKFGYYVKDLTIRSGKRIIVNCDKCNKIREISKASYRPLCKSCSLKGKNSGPLPKGTGEKISKAKKGVIYSKERNQKISKALKGRRSPNYKDGRTIFIDCVYGMQEYFDWRTTVFKRDNYICQECNQVGGKLEVHHIKRLKLIIIEFLQTYSQFSPIEDKEILVRLAISYQPFWDINNGKTLCYNCHSKTYKQVNKEN